MKYYTKNNELYANPKDVTGMVEVESPVRDDGSILPNHKNLGQLDVDAEDKLYKYYKQDGTPDLERILLEDTNNALQSIESAIQAYIDNQAKQLGYDDIVSACSYASYANTYQTEAIALGNFRTACWDKAYSIQADVKAGTRTMPTTDEVIVELPKYTGV